MSGSAKDRGQATGRGTLSVPYVEDDEEVLPWDDEELTSVVDRIRRIATSLDVHSLHEEELIQLSDAALRLAGVAKAQSIQRRSIASLRAQVEDWEAQHGDVVVGADVTTRVEVVTNALAALRERIDESVMGRDDVGSTLDLVEKWLTVDRRYRAMTEELTQAATMADFQSVHSLTDRLESLDAELRQARRDIDIALAIQRPHKSTPDELAADYADSSEPGMTEPTDSMEEDARSAGEREPGKPVRHDEVRESTAVKAPTPSEESENGQRRAAPDRPPQPRDDGPDVETAGDSGGTADDVESVQPIKDAIGMLIGQGRLGLAYHLSLAASKELPSATAIKLAAYSYLIDEHTPVAVTTELPELAAALLQETETVADEGSGWGSHVFLATCAALAPALVAPGGPVAQLLTFFDPWLESTPSLRALARTAAEVSLTGVHLPIDLLRGEDSLERWRARESALRSDIKSWLASERQSQLRYQAATKVWRRMLDNWERSNGQSSLGRMFWLLDDTVDDTNIDTISRISGYWKSHGEKEIDRIDRKNRSWKSTAKIEGSARLSLRHKVNQAVDLSDRWLRLITERPEKRLPFQTDQARILRTTVHNNIEAALAELAALSMRGFEGVQALLQRYATLFDSANGRLNPYHLGLNDILNGELLAHPAIAFDDTGHAPISPVDLDVLWNLVRRDKPNFGQAAVERARLGDFIGAEAALDIAERTGRIDEDGADQSRTVIESERDRIQSDLTAKINDTIGRLDAAYAAGALPLRIYEQQRDRLPTGDLSGTNTFETLFTTLKDIDAGIADAEARRRDAVRASLNRLHGLANEDRERIQSAIDSSRFQVAENFIERIEHGQKLPALDTRSDRPFDRFFPKFVEKYSVLHNREGDGMIFHAQDVIARRSFEDFIDASGLSQDASQDGIELLNAWMALRDGRTSVNALRAFTRALGFTHTTVRRIDEETLGGEPVFVLDAAPVADRSIAQLPDFGSRANGKYRLFAVRNRKTGEAIIREMDRPLGAVRSPNIVLFLGVLDAESRRVLGRDFQSGGYHPTIVLDESLAVFLAAWAGHRLAAFFDCVSAFTFSQPFEPDAAELPPEMFFGRKDARQAIVAMSHDIAHFVYGGRRLGKTTLLADIAREYRSRAPEELVLLINLKGSGIGENRPTEDLWRFFAEKLTEHEVVGSGTRRAESVWAGVKKWLRRNDGRRILLLVDEADVFLEAESRPNQDYRVLQQVKTLMEETERRFKVVFAGLHNVQRAARDPNTPLAHLGEAIRIGPMFPETDGTEIEKLIRDPLEALGYRFASSYSVIRVAAETNYYPALAQQFCKELLKALREEVYSLGEAGPPYPIQPELVDRVFNAKETRDRIRNLFSWTIHLDLRYEFLTYLVAKYSFDNEEGRLQSMPIAAIRDAALSEWPEGFASDRTFWTFEVLLEEMVGLGILREMAGKEYAIRTRNLRVLLGNDDQIDRRFVDAKSRIAPPTFDRAQFRRTLEGDRRSSLTAHQETRLLSGLYGVGLVFGTRLAGLDRVRESLEEAAARREESLFIQEVVKGGLPRSVRRRALRTRKAGVHILLLDMREAWDVRVLVNALDFVGTHEWENRIIRPIMLCDPAGAWSWLNETVSSNEEVELHDIWLGPCGRDFTRIWLKDQESRPLADLERSDRCIDPPWPLVVETAAENKQLESIEDAIGITLDQDHDNQYVADILGISQDMDTALRLLSTFSDESMTPDFLSGLCDDEGTVMSPEEVIDFFSWASHLGVVYRDEDGYRLDSTYAEGLERVFRG